MSILIHIELAAKTKENQRIVIVLLLANGHISWSTKKQQICNFIFHTIRIHGIV